MAKGLEKFHEQIGYVDEDKCVKRIYIYIYIYAILRSHYTLIKMMRMKTEDKSNC